ncbi:MAG: HEAT repeat domain-containing protein [Planctomycetota bacterium JB042]
MSRSTRLRPLVFVASFAATLAAFLLLAEPPPTVALDEAPPVLAVGRGSAPPDRLLDPIGDAGPVAETRVAAASDPPADSVDADAAVSGAAAFDRARFDAALDAIAETRPTRRARLLSSKRAFLGARLVQELLAAGTGPGGLAASLERLEVETDPLLQAVLLLHVTAFEHDPRALAALDRAAASLLADPSRPVPAQVAVDGLLAAMGRQGVEPSRLVHHVAATTDDPIVLRDLWLGLANHGFDFEASRPLLEAGLAHASAAARFGAAESLRMFALDGRLSPAEFVAEFGPIVLAESDRNNRLLFLETLGAVGRDAATPTLLALARSEEADPEARRLAAASLALHGGEETALTYCREALLAADPDGRRAAITALGALPSAAATEALVELVAAAAAPEERREALRALEGKQDAPVDPFLAAVGADDEELRRTASRHLLLVDEASLPEADRARLKEWRHASARDAADPQVRADAAMAAFLNDGADGEALLEERLAADPSPTVRGSAASALFLTRWARGDEAALARLEDVVANESPSVRGRLRGQLERIRELRPDEIRTGLEEQLRMLGFVRSVAEAGPGTKDVFGRQHRLVERLLARMGP